MPSLAAAWIAIGSSLMAQAPTPTSPPPSPPTFADDAGFLAEHADSIVLQAAGAGPLAVSPRLSGRVMTSAFAPDEPGFGLVHRPAIDGSDPDRSFANYGGEDRLWIAPEGGPWALFFDPGAAQELPNWRVPAAMDGAPRTVVRREATAIEFRDSAVLANVKGARFDLSIERRIEALPRADVARLLAVQVLPDTLRVVAFRSVNTLRNAARTLPHFEGMIAPWVLGQFKPSPLTRVLFPFRGEPSAITPDYYGRVPAERLTLGKGADGAGGLATFTADSQLRAKIGVSASGATGWIGAFDPERGVLTLVHHTLPAPSDFVPDCRWLDPNLRAMRGDVATSYNHFQEPRFFELESIGRSLPVALESRVTHVHATIHLGGDRAGLAAIARTVLNAEL